MARGVNVTRIVLRGRKVVGGVAEGEALVTGQTISTWGGVNAAKGIISEQRHELKGQHFKEKILVFPSAKGSSGWSTVAQMIRMADQSPKAMIIRDINSLSGIGAIVMRVPTVTDLDQDPTRVIATGDWVKIDGDRGIVEVTQKTQAAEGT